MFDNEEKWVDAQVMTDYLVALFTTTGMSDRDAEFCADALVQTNLWGVDSHGVLRAPVYLQRARSGAVNPRPDIRAVRSGGAMALLDGDDGMGFVVGRAAMEKAIAWRRNSISVPLA
jgi:LDH2 family malate/lactate/ureidoglycolate dehydrogenase